MNIEHYYQPEIWSVKKDDIYAAIACVDAGLEHARSALIEHDERLGRTTHKNKWWAEQLEADIRKMSLTLACLKALPQPVAEAPTGSALAEPATEGAASDLSAAFTNYINDSGRASFSQSEEPAFNAGAKWADQRARERLKEAEAEIRKWREAYVTHPPTLIALENKLKEAEAKLAEIAKAELTYDDDFAADLVKCVIWHYRNEGEGWYEYALKTLARKINAFKEQAVARERENMEGTIDLLGTMRTWHLGDRYRFSEQATEREAWQLLHDRIGAEIQRLTQPANRSAEEGNE